MMGHLKARSESYDLETFWLCSGKTESGAERAFPEEFARDIWHSSSSNRVLPQVFDRL